MSRKLCLLFAALCLAVAVVKSEPNIEVDENGDEYEVKRFNVQGRQLEGGRSQCVVTRRKRSTVVIAPQEQSGEDADHTAAAAFIFYSPAVENDDDEDNDDDNDDKMDDVKEEPMDAVVPYGNEDEDGQDAGNEEDEPETIEVVQVPQLPIIGQLQSQGESVAAITSGGESSPESDPPSSAETDNADKIVVVQADEPPKVNPDTHAVFELVPVGQHSHDKGVVIGSDGQIVHITTGGYGDDGDDDDNESDNDNDDDFHYNEELSPVTTTAIWSTGDDDNYDDLPPKRVQKPVRRPTKNKKKNKNNKINKNRNKNRNKNKNTKVRRQRRPLRNPNRYNKRRPHKRVPTSRPNRRRTNNKRRKSKPRKGLKKKTGTRVNRPRVQPTTTSPEEIDTRGDNNESNLHKVKDHTKKKNTNSNANLNEVAKRRGNKNNVNIVDQGTNTFTRTVTMTQTGGPDDGGDVNCIYINKEPTPTTARPFWDILGRSANGAPVASGHYGKRKRANLRLVA